jgi:hypothetical protein
MLSVGADAILTQRADFGASLLAEVRVILTALRMNTCQVSFGTHTHTKRTHSTAG